MTNTEYRKNIQGFYSYNFWDSLNPYEEKELRKDIKNRTGYMLPNSNYRASVRPTENGLILTSYYTDVLELENGKIFRLWDGYSKTTAKHINIFLESIGRGRVNKKELFEIPLKV